MAIVKQPQAAPMLKEAIVLDLGDLGRQAAKLRVAAESRAAQIIEDAQREAQRLIAEASDKGYQAGHDKGLRQGMEEGRKKGHAEAVAAAGDKLTKLQQAWSDVASQWESQRKAMTREANQAVLHFALALAERVVHRVLEVDRTVVVDQVANALAHVLRPMDPIVKINPADRPLVEEAMPQLLREFSQFDHVELVEDESVSEGGCVVATGQGLIDAQIETQLERIVEAMLPGAARPIAKADATTNQKSTTTAPLDEDIPEGMELLEDEPDGEGDAA